MPSSRSHPKSVDPGVPRLGPAPDGWSTARIGDLVTEVHRPVKLEQSRSYALVVAKRSRGGIVSRGRLLGGQIRTKSQFEVRGGDFLISRRQIVHGACGIVPSELDGAIVSNEYTVLRASDNLRVRFLDAIAATPYLQRTFYHSSVGVHVEKMVFREAQWFRYQLHFPPPSEQEAILSALTSWQTAVKLTDQLCKLARRRKSGLMRELLTGKMRFRGFEDTSWRLRPLAEVAQVNSESLPESTPADHIIRYIDLSSVDQGRLAKGPTTLRFDSAPSRARRIVRRGDSLISMVRPGLMGHLLVRDDSPDLVCSTGFAVVRAAQAADAAFLYHQFFGHDVERQLSARLAGSGFPAVSADDVRRVRIAYCGNTMERRRIGDLLELNEREIDLLDRLRETLERQRLAVAELLLTGKVRIAQVSRP